MGARGSSTISTGNNLPQIAEITDTHMYRNEDKLLEQFSKDTGYSGKEAKDNLQLIDKWVGGLKDDRKKLNKRKLDSVIDRMTKFNGTAYRGLYLTNQQLNKYKPGESLNLKDVSSFTSDKNVAVDFATFDKTSRKQPTVLVVPNSKQGARAGYFGVHNEAEVMYKSTSKFKIKSKDYKDGITYIYLKEE